ncbi:SDR family NAD(P)-dependent oxidoreductase [Nocardioides alcanivorans]|uniref:SDR family NAD(P)-dependent oxidoreductase n=1 Tax=Nocardioides alcanivorans TaxID=2897352 RepID=UPI001F2A0748|nr:SDR family NAD(P)-dependent oxidoreductase [Nocardioides alcanivorans]
MRPSYVGQEGRRFIVTGGSTGIGLEMCRALATAGADVVMAVRNLERGHASAERIRRTGAPGRVDVRRIDVSDLSSVRTFADQIDRVDVLINNAGILGVPFARSVDGHEMQFATNYLGHFALSNLLLPVLRDRVVMVGSFAHHHGRLPLDDLDFDRRGYQGYLGYAQSKVAQVSFIGELHRRLRASGSLLRSVGGHPGFSATAITVSTGHKLFTPVARLGNVVAGMKPWQGALPLLVAATADVPSNSYLGPNGPLELLGSPKLVGRSRVASDPRVGRELWDHSERITGVRFPG